MMRPHCDRCEKLVTPYVPSITLQSPLDSKLHQNYGVAVVAPPSLYICKECFVIILQALVDRLDPDGR